MQITEIHFDSIDSTSSYAKREYASFSRDKMTVVTADEQTAGYGRYKRKWVSPKGVNLYATFCFRLPFNAIHLSSLAEVMGLSLASMLIEEGLHPKIKWPNDVQLNHKKVSGVLCETVFEKDSIQIFLGIGINVNMEKEALERIDQPATSLKNETGRPWDAKALLKKLETLFLADLERFKKEGFAPFKGRVENLLAYKGERIRCFDGKKEWVGVCHSLSPEGLLNLSLPDGTLHVVHSGDILTG
jgi:BirA family transcriptional regulator, biotin operon repressor / biotin---[acetyl-CoA-carboxylase] ligase